MMKSHIAWIVFSGGLLASPLCWAYSAPVEMRAQPEVVFSKPFSAAETGEQPAVSEPLSPPQESVQAMVSHDPDRLEMLSEEVRQLRGIVEMQAHYIKQLQVTQQRQFQDMDQRLAALSSASPEKPKPSSSFFHRKQAEPEKAPEPVEEKKPQTAQLQMDQQQLYGVAYNYLKNREFSKARPVLEQYVQQYPQGQYAVNAHYWLGELLLVSGETQQAKIEFNTVVSNYPTSSKMADAMLKLGFIYADEGQPQAARKQ